MEFSKDDELILELVKANELLTKKLTIAVEALRQLNGDGEIASKALSLIMEG